MWRAFFQIFLNKVINKWCYKISQRAGLEKQVCKSTWSLPGEAVTSCGWTGTTSPGQLTSLRKRKGWSGAPVGTSNCQKASNHGTHTRVWSACGGGGGGLPQERVSCEEKAETPEDTEDNNWRCVLGNILLFIRISSQSSDPSSNKTFMILSSSPSLFDLKTWRNIYINVTTVNVREHGGHDTTTLYTFWPVVLSTRSWTALSLDHARVKAMNKQHHATLPSPSGRVEQY